MVLVVFLLSTKVKQGKEKKVTELYKMVGMVLGEKEKSKSGNKSRY